MLLKVTGYVQTIFLLMVVILGALCAEERVVLINCPNQTQKTKALYVGQHGVVKLVHPSKAQTIRMIGVPRSKTKSDIQYLTLFSKDTELYICYNKKWKIVGMKVPSERCYFKEGRLMEYISYLNNSLYIGFVCKNGVCKSAGPDEKSECFSSTKHEPNEIHDYYRKLSPSVTQHNNSHSVHNNSRHKIRHRKKHQKHRDKHPHTSTTTSTTSSTTSTTTTTTSTTTTTPQPFKRKNKKKLKKSRPLKKLVTASDFVTAEIYSSSASYQPESETSSSSSSSSSFSFDADPTGAGASASSSISSIMDSSSYGSTDATEVSSTNIPVSPNKLSSTTEYNNNYLINSNKNNLNRKLRKHHSPSTISTLNTLDVVPTATLFTTATLNENSVPTATLFNNVPTATLLSEVNSPSSSTTDWDVITDYTSDRETASSSSQPSSSSYYFNHNDLSEYVSTQFNFKSSTYQEEQIFSEDPSSTSSVFYQQVVVPTSSTLVARKKSNFLNNFSSSSSFSPKIEHKVEQNASTSLRKLLEIEEK